MALRTGETTMSKQEGLVPKKYIFARNDEKCKTGFVRIEEAQKHAETIPETEEQRVRVRYRSRSGAYDVVVKSRREVK